MEKILLAVFVLMSHSLSSQNLDPNSKEGKVSPLDDTMPEFPRMNDSSSSEQSLLWFLAKNMRYPLEAKMNNVQGVVYISFTVDKRGDVVNVKIKQGVHPSLDEEAIHVIELMPQWKPGTHQGENVSVDYDLPVRFLLRDLSPSSQRNLNKWDVSKATAESAERFARAGKYEKAISIFSRAIKQDKKNKDAFYNRGVCHYKLKDMDAACADWEKAKKLGDRESKKFLDQYCD